MTPWPKLRLHARLLAGTKQIGEKNGSKHHLLVDGRGVALSVAVTGANRHDVTKLEIVLDEIVIDSPKNEQRNLCADKGYTGDAAIKAIEGRDHVPHIKRLQEEIQEMKHTRLYCTLLRP
jgi:IS5 family transposase